MLVLLYRQLFFFLPLRCVTIPTLGVSPVPQSVCLWFTSTRAAAVAAFAIGSGPGEGRFDPALCLLVGPLGVGAGVLGISHLARSHRCAGAGYGGGCAAGTDVPAAPRVPGGHQPSGTTRVQHGRLAGRRSSGDRCCRQSQTRHSPPSLPWSL